jgi:hypothetical protein
LIRSIDAAHGDASFEEDAAAQSGAAGVGSVIEPEQAPSARTAAVSAR